ncbi:MAG: hypothetical protein AAF152_03235 [Cyanobacteria bacterium P01_A01_bin.114]
MRTAAFQKQGSRGTFVSFTVGLTALFAVLGLVGILHHEMWRDELQAWMLARDSTSLIDLWENMRTEGHPALWHLCLYGLAKISPNPLLMQLFHLGIATVNVCLIAKFSPFTRLQRSLLAFGYFNFYEYAIVSRSYSLGLLFILIFCSLYSWLQFRRTADQTPDNQPQQTGQKSTSIVILLMCLALGLLANTSVYGLLLSMTLALTLGLMLVQQRDWHIPAHLSGWGLGLIGLLSSWLICYLQISRINLVEADFKTALDESEAAESGVNLLIELAEVISKVWRSYVPIPAWWNEGVWNTNVLSDLNGLTIGGQSVGDGLAFLMALLLIGLVTKALWHQPKWLALYSLGTVGQLTFIAVFHAGNIRHHGHLFLLLLVCLWLAKTDRPSLTQPASLQARLPQIKPARFQQRLLTVVLICHAFAGGLAYSLDLAQPFSGSKDTADFLRSQNLAHLPIFGYNDYQVSTIAGYLNRPIYYPNLDKFGSFWTIRVVIEPEEVAQQIPTFVNQREEPTVLILTDKLEQPVPDVNYQYLAYIQSKLMKGESFYIYLAKPVA